MTPVGLGLIASLLGVAPAAAQMNVTCDHQPYAEIVARLSGLNERVVATAEYGSDAILHIFASPGGKFWTAVTVRKDNGRACMVGVGTHWKALPTFEREK